MERHCDNGFAALSSLRGGRVPFSWATFYRLKVVEIEVNQVSSIASYFRHYAGVQCTLSVYGNNQAELGVDGNAR
jgi:hypothetical protein